jgi:hypothetical protein
MASTYSPLKIELIGTGEQSGTWGNTTNINLGTAIEEAITGSADVTFSSADITLTLTNTNTTQTARNLRLNLIGTSGGARILTVPDIEKFYIIRNALANTVTVKNTTGVTFAVPAGVTAQVFSTGTGVVSANDYYAGTGVFTSLNVTGNTILGDASSDTITSNAGTFNVPNNLVFSGTGAIAVPVGTTAQLPGTPATGMIRYNTDYDTFEGYSGTAWGSIGSGATGGGGDQVFVENSTIVTTSYTFPTGKNAMSVGPITINGGVAVTVPSGQRWVVL